MLRGPSSYHFSRRIFDPSDISAFTAMLNKTPERYDQVIVKRPSGSQHLMRAITLARDPSPRWRVHGTHGSQQGVLGEGGIIVEGDGLAQRRFDPSEHRQHDRNGLGGK
jgi:hypothetical protein